MSAILNKNWKDLIRPNRPVVEHDRDAQRKAKLVIEPLEQPGLRARDLGQRRLAADARVVALHEARAPRRD